MSLLGRGRAKKGMFMGDLNEGELEIGQVSALMDTIKPATDIVHEIIEDSININNFKVEISFFSIERYYRPCVVIYSNKIYWLINYAHII